MAHNQLFTSQPNVFGGFQDPFEMAEYVILGVPFDVTSTYRSGARFGPTAIRQASLNIEDFSFRTDIEMKDLHLHDLGDLDISIDTTKTLERLEYVIKDILKVEKTPVVIGGEHTITLGVLKGLQDMGSKPAILCFDAHLDLRDEFLGVKLSHASFMRRIQEEVNPPRIFEVGTRGVCKEELNYAKKAGIEFFSTWQIRNEGTKKIAEKLKRRLADFESIYISVDMDVLDPAYAPAVQNPEPEGLETHTLLEILCNICDRRVEGFDIVEVTPHYDDGVSAIQAAKIVFEVLCSLEKMSRS